MHMQRTTVAIFACNFHKR